MPAHRHVEGRASPVARYSCFPDRSHGRARLPGVHCSLGQPDEHIFPGPCQKRCGYTVGRLAQTAGPRLRSVPRQSNHHPGQVRRIPGRCRGYLHLGKNLPSFGLWYTARVTIMRSKVIPGRIMRAIRTVVVLTIVGTLIPCQRASAQEEIRRVSLAQALQAFAENSLELQIARSQRSEAAGLARQLRAYANPAFSLVREDLGSSGENYWETTAGVVQQVEWPGRTAARNRAAIHVVAAATARLRADSLSLAYKICEAYLRAWLAEEAELTVRRAASVLGTVADDALRRLEEGDISDYEARRLRLERLQAEHEVAEATLQARATRSVLAGLIAPGDKGGEIGPSEAPGESPPLLTVPVVLESLAERPDVEAAARELDAARARRLISATEWVPNPTIGLGYKDQADGFSGAAMTFSVPLPVFDQGAGSRQSASARELAATRRLDLARRLAEIDLRGASDRYASTRSRLETAGRVMLTDAEALLATALSAYAEDEMTLLELLDAAKAFREARLSALSLRFAAWIAYYDLMRAMGATLEGK